jgi:hypothetical protein
MASHLTFLLLVTEKLLIFLLFGCSTMTAALLLAASGSDRGEMLEDFSLFE